MKINLIKHFILSLFLFSNFSFWAHGSELNKKSLYESIENFRLLDHQGNSHELYYNSDAEFVLLVWQDNNSSVIQQNLKKLRSIMDSFDDDLVVFMINANWEQSRSDVFKTSQKYGVEIPILLDSTQIITKNLNVSQVGESLLVRTLDWKIVYRDVLGNLLKKVIDEDNTPATLSQKNNHSFDKHQSSTISNTIYDEEIDFKIDQRLDLISYQEEVSPIIINKCFYCHSSGGSAPFSLDDYQTIKGWGPMIREVIRTQRMPPMSIDPEYGDFLEDKTLSSEEIYKIVNWIEQGMPNSDDEDPVKNYKRINHKDWQLGPPTIILSMDGEQFIPASEKVPPHLHVRANKSIEEDIWVRHAELKPGNIKSVHHGAVFFVAEDIFDSDKHRNKMPDVTVLDNFFTTYYAGQQLFNQNNTCKDGAFFIPAGSDIVFRFHYLPTGKDEIDMSKLGLYLCNDKTLNGYGSLAVADKDFVIPPGVRKYPLSSSRRIKEDVFIKSLRPHMHDRGRSARFRVIYPDGSEEILASIPDYKFKWQANLTYKEKKFIPKGSTIVFEGVFDNSILNPYNPDHTKEVRFGEGENDEMFVGFIRLIKIGQE